MSKKKPLGDGAKRTATHLTGLFKKWSIDLTHIEEGEYDYIIGCHDDLFSWPEYQAIRKATAKNIKKFLLTQIIPRYGQLYMPDDDRWRE